ncbi:helix-turn-helix domain-containing protein [Actinomadura chokoriensis]|uniref:Helix-turn-helix transcriptional regulator n=1 Tax=Actinomadura chokoriensis TaxID=454156 RepID=A0ABV4R9I1_9ACTN
MAVDEQRHRPGALGPTGRFVAGNLARMRGTQGLSTTELSRRLKAAGRPISPTSITKIEKGTRRVDVDDLVALSVVLGVNPNALLFPDAADASPIEVTAAERLNTAYEVWQWADGREPLRDDDDPDEFHVRVRPRGRRRLVRHGERSPEELQHRRKTVETMAAHLFAERGPAEREAFLARQKRWDPEPWESDNESR